MTNDTQLQLAIAKMLPEKLGYEEIKDSTGKVCYAGVWWRHEHYPTKRTNILPTEWEHIVRLVEEALTDEELVDYVLRLEDEIPFRQNKFGHYFNLIHASWQQRAQAILKVKGVV